MSIVLQSSGGGSVTLQEAVTASNLTITVPAVTGTMATTTTPSFTTTIGVGGATPAASGAGITFPSTQSASTDANTLDDYEEGTWTPALFGTSSDPTITYSNRLGRYIKIGKMVYAFYFIAWTGKSGGSGEMRMTLPITSDGTAANYPSGQYTDFNGITWSASYTMLQGEIHPNTSLIYFVISGSGTSTTSLQTSAFGASGYVYGNAVYEAAS